MITAAPLALRERHWDAARTMQMPTVALDFRIIRGGSAWGLTLRGTSWAAWREEGEGRWEEGWGPTSSP